MSVPLKVSAATSGVLLAMGNSAAIWPYINVGALIGVIAAPWMLGQIIGGIMGAHILGIQTVYGAQSLGWMPITKIWPL